MRDVRRKICVHIRFCGNGYTHELKSQKAEQKKRRFLIPEEAPFFLNHSFYIRTETLLSQNLPNGRVLE